MVRRSTFYQKHVISAIGPGCYHHAVGRHSLMDGAMFTTGHGSIDG